MIDNPIDTEDWEDEEEEEDLDELLAKHLKTLPNWKQYVNRMYQSDGLFFYISGEGSITAASDTFTYGLKDCHSPTLFSGISNDEETYLDNMMERLGFDADFFSNALADIFTDDASDVESYFENEDEEEDEGEKNLEIFRAMKQEIESGSSPFKSMNHFISAVSRYHLGNDIYYMWEGSACSLEETFSYDSISLDETGLDKEDWIDILNNLDKCNIETDDEYFVNEDGY